MPSLRLRVATVEDAAAIASLVASAEDVRQVAPNESHPLAPDAVERWLTERNAGYVLEDETDIVAYGEVNPDGYSRRRFWIGHVVVSTATRGTGIGQQMVASLANVALTHLKAKDVWLSAFADNPPALSCYRRAGFRETGRREMLQRELIDLVYDPPHRRRLLGRRTTAFLAAAMAGITGALLPSETRFWLMDMTGGRQIAVLAVAIVVAALAAWLLHPILPRGEHRDSEQLLRPLGFGIALGLSVALTMALLLHVATSTPTGLASDLVEATLGGLQFGGGWGLVLVIYAETRGRARPA